jgi:energy-coupling factor transporter ATP-binding protein EcfA2
MEVKNRVLILVGPNGIGKSTILDIVYNLIQGKIDCVSKYQIDYIKIILTDQSCIILDKTDLLPSLEEIKKIANEKQNRLFGEEFVDLDEEDAISVFAQMSNYYSLLAKLNDKDLLREYLISCYFGYEQSAQLYEIVLDAISLENPSLSVKGITKFIMNEFNKSVIEEKGVLLKSLLAYRLDISQEVIIDNRPVHRSTINSPTVKWVLENRNISEFGKYMISDKLKELGGEEVVPLLKKILSNANDFNVFHSHKQSLLTSKIEDSSIEFENYFKTNILDINRIVSKEYFSNDYIINLNKKAVKILANNIGNEEWSQNQYLIDFYSGEIKINILRYYSPVVMNGLFVDFDNFEKEFNLINSSFNFKRGMDCLKELYEVSIDEITDEKNINPKMKIFIKLIKDYFGEDLISVYPSGIEITKRTRVRKEKGILSMIENFDNNIRINCLSAGQKKILLLITFIVFGPQNTLLIDEPEASSSIIWQEKIMKNILEIDSNCAYIIATQSPYIISNEKLLDSLIFLPSEEADE